METCQIAILMTCYNRKASTLSCLDRLERQEGVDDIVFDLYLVDDGSMDGTGDAVRQKFNAARIFQGNGELYWGGGMRLAFDEALKNGYDFYLWLNNDSLLFEDAIRMMMDSFKWVQKKTGETSIIAGAFCDAKSRAISYSGVNRGGFWRISGTGLIMPSRAPVSCDMINGNCVLIPHNIAAVVGNICSDFTHRLGDYDYSLRAKLHGFSSWITPGYVGTCSRNHRKSSYKDHRLSVKERADILSKGPTSVIPPAEWMLFVRRHFKYIWLIYWLRTFIRVKFPRLWVLLRMNKRKASI